MLITVNDNINDANKSKIIMKSQFLLIFRIMKLLLYDFKKYYIFEVIVFKP